MTQLPETTAETTTNQLAVVPADEPLVYYIRRDGLIKIGYTSRFTIRMRDLRPDEVLAVEPGNLAHEARRHQQFGRHRLVDHPAGREWFEPAPELLDHITSLAATYVVPELRPPTPRGPGPAPEPLTLEERQAVDTILRYQGADCSQLDAETLASLAKALLLAPRILQVCLHGLVGHGENFAGIAKYLDVHQATVARWTKSPAKDRRRRGAD